MLFKDTPIKRKLMLVNLLTSGAVLLVTCIAFFAYELYTFRQTTLTKLNSLGEITAANSTAALAFDDVTAANEILAALHAEPNIVAAVLYDSLENPFAQYPMDLDGGELSIIPKKIGFGYSRGHLEGVQPVRQGTKFLGTLYLKSNLKALEEHFLLYGMVVLMVMAFSILLAYILSQLLSKSISRPILALSKAAQAISHRQDYSVRAVREGNDELGFLTDAFNDMLEQIQAKDHALNRFNRNLENKVAERNLELEISLKEQKEAQREVFDKNKQLSQALEELQRTKDELVNLNNDLEQRVEERTKEVIAKNHELEKVNIDLDNFIYTASHDLKSPISNLEGLIRIVKEELANITNPTHLEFLDMMEISITKLRNTILDLAEITKVQKNLEQDAELVSFKQILHDVKEDLMFNNQMAVAINQKLEVEEIYYPVHGLRSVLYNLLSNAIKYRSGERPVQINIHTFKENGAVVLLVEDNGMGIEKRHLPKLFSMFKRFHSHVDGTGIGLYIIKRIVENQGGEIQYISKGDQGSIFKVFL